MRLFFWINLLVYSTISWSYSDQFQIKIHNHGQADCVLTKSNILFGHISDHTAIPMVIHAGETQTFLMRGGPHYKVIFLDKSLLLAYSCGPQQNITLFITDGRHPTSVEGRILEKEVIDAKFIPYESGLFESGIDHILVQLLY